MLTMIVQIQSDIQNIAFKKIVFFVFKKLNKVYSIVNLSFYHNSTRRDTLIVTSRTLKNICGFIFLLH